MKWYLITEVKDYIEFHAIEISKTTLKSLIMHQMSQQSWLLSGSKINCCVSSQTTEIISVVVAIS